MPRPDPIKQNYTELQTKRAVLTAEKQTLQQSVADKNARITAINQELADLNASMAALDSSIPDN